MEQQPTEIKLRTPEEADRAARELFANPEEMESFRRALELLDEQKRVSRETLMFEFTI